MHLYYVYILASQARVLYIGVTRNLEQRLIDHRASRKPDSFTSLYRVIRLVHVEEYTDIRQAIDREKQMKSWRRSKKVRLIEKANPEWRDLAAIPLPGPSPSLRSGSG
jgi:putative endonuclease